MAIADATTPCAGWKPRPGASRARSRSPIATCRRAGRLRAALRATPRRCRTWPRSSTRKLPDAPHRRKLGLAAHRLAATRAGTPAGYDEPGRIPPRPRRPAAIARRRRRAADSRGASSSTSLAGGDVRVPPGRDGGAAARRSCWPPAARRARASDRPAVSAATARGGSPRSARSPTSRIGSGARRLRARDRQLHPSAPTISQACSSSRASPCPRSRPTCAPVPLLEIAPRARDGAARSSTGWIAMPGARRRLGAGTATPRGDGRLLGLGQGGRHARGQPRAVPAPSAAMAAWAQATRPARSRSSTDAAARSGAAAAPPAARSRPSRPDRCGGRFKVTEQGEVAFARYGNAALARAPPRAAHERGGPRRPREGDGE